MNLLPGQLVEVYVLGSHPLNYKDWVSGVVISVPKFYSGVDESSILMVEIELDDDKWLLSEIPKVTSWSINLIRFK